MSTVPDPAVQNLPPSPEREIHFTQYLMPDGRTNDVTIRRPEAIVAMADKIVAAGFRFECEMLSDYNTVSLTIFDPKREVDVAIELATNGPDVPRAVDYLIEAFLRGKIPAKQKASRA